ncbi:MAG: hypothetical protein JXR37_09620 [Kiritimatiellae bacterium]|nr:hypothetical protein [Kiritimatiellia bacterium]
MLAWLLILTLVAVLAIGLARIGARHRVLQRHPVATSALRRVAVAVTGACVTFCAAIAVLLGTAAVLGGLSGGHCHGAAAAGRVIVAYCTTVSLITGVVCSLHVFRAGQARPWPWRRLSLSAGVAALLPTVLFLLTPLAFALAGPLRARGIVIGVLLVASAGALSLVAVLSFRKKKRAAPRDGRVPQTFRPATSRSTPPPLPGHMGYPILLGLGIAAGIALLLSALYMFAARAVMRHFTDAGYRGGFGDIGGAIEIWLLIGLQAVASILCALIIPPSTLALGLATRSPVRCSVGMSILFVVFGLLLNLALDITGVTALAPK